MTDEILPFLQSLIQRGAAFYPLASTPQEMRIGAAEWLPGQGLLVAEFGAEHQGQVHLVKVDELTTDGDAPEVDLLDASGRYLGTIMPDETITAEQLAAWNERVQSENWGRFWIQEITNAKGGR